MVGRIFLAVGSQMPFDRLVAAVYQWFVQWPQGKGAWQVNAQVGHAELSLAEVDGWRSYAFLLEHDFRMQCQQADIIVGHVGMGLVLTALEYARPMLLLPRLAQWRETRNDHQLGTARWLAQHSGITIAKDELDLVRTLTQMASQEHHQNGGAANFFKTESQADLVAYLRGVLDSYVRAI
jgi:UDP-N-acetylglucosamine transferase subunit ALG13